VLPEFGCQRSYVFVVKSRINPCSDSRREIKSSKLRALQMAFS